MLVVIVLDACGQCVVVVDARDATRPRDAVLAVLVFSNAALAILVLVTCQTVLVVLSS